jgi:[ribosomal protein S5]-alanine N-acetyltransferase
VNAPLCIETPRLRLRWLQTDDAEFIYRLVNDPDWLRHIGDRKVSNRAEGRAYVENNMIAMYRCVGFGLNRVALKKDDTPIGICGLLRRDTLPCSDLGYALLPEFRNQGYALEAARAVLEHGFSRLAQTQLCATVSADNHASIQLLDKLGFRFDRQILMAPDNHTVELYSIRSPLKPTPEST